MFVGHCFAGAAAVVSRGFCPLAMALKRSHTRPKKEPPRHNSAPLTLPLGPGRAGHEALGHVSL